MPGERRIVLGEILGAHGLQGELRVRIAGDSADNLLDAEALWLGRSVDDPGARRYRVRGGGPGRSGEVRLRLEGIGDRATAEALVRQVVMIEADALPKLPEGEFYWHELVGCRVESESGRPLGRVSEIWETGAHDVLVILDDAGQRRLVPTAEALMKQVDLDARLIVVVELPGLLEPA